MKAISLWQPWASLIMTGAKKIETRSRPTKVRGRVAIHAAKKCTIEAMELLETPEFQRGLLSILPKGMKQMILQLLPRGAIVGTVEIVGCLQITECFDGKPIALLSDGTAVLAPQFMYGDYRPGRFAWMLKDPIMFEKPIPARGSQGFWNWDENALKEAKI